MYFHARLAWGREENSGTFLMGEAWQAIFEERIPRPCRQLLDRYRQPLCNDFDRSESAAADGWVGKLSAQHASHRFAIAFLVSSGEFFGLLWREPLQKVNQLIWISELLETGFCALGKSPL